jgi:CDP-diacylglycerol--glycerol-3-phosphate 3-phosphatidyltransferase
VNIPNQLTCIRIVLAGVFMWLVASPGAVCKTLALLTFLAATLTDYFDGRIARSRGQITQFGKLMDPIADKLLTFSAFIMFVQMGLVPAWSVALIVVRDLAVTGARLMMPHSGRVAADSSGKQKTVIQFAFIVGVLLFVSLREWPGWQAGWNAPVLGFVHGAMLFVVAVTLWSGALYLAKNRDFFEKSSA